MVSMTTNKQFVAPQTITFDKIITNVGDGYIDDVNNVDYGKFIAPVNGTYQFNVNLYNEDHKIGCDLMKNQVFIITANNGGSGPASVTAILDLKEGDHVYLKTPGWGAAWHHRSSTSFSGSLSRSTI